MASRTEKGLTPKQLSILRMVRDCRNRRGYSPTMQEVAEELGITKVTVFEHVEALIRKGALRRDPNKARSLQPNPDFVLPHEEQGTRVPLAGRIAAGQPIEAVEQQEHLDFEQMFAAAPQGQSVFALEVRGESMIEDGIHDGDHVICRQTENPRRGETVVALLEDGEATLKRYYPEKNGRKIRLQPANEAYEPIWVSRGAIQIQGVVIGLVRSF